MNIKLYGKLIERARNRGQIFYSKTGPGIRGAPGKELEAISRHEAGQKRPMLSVLVVEKGTGIPSSGFLLLGKQLGLVLPGESEAQFVARQRAEVYETWED